MTSVESSARFFRQSLGLINKLARVTRPSEAFIGALIFAFDIVLTRMQKQYSKEQMLVRAGVPGSQLRVFCAPHIPLHTLLLSRVQRRNK
jgi:hypothetical protein